MCYRGIWCLCVIDHQNHILNIINFDYIIRIHTGTSFYKEICNIIKLFDKEDKPNWRIVLQTRKLSNEYDSGIAVCMYADFHINSVNDFQVNEKNVVYYKKYILLSLGYDGLALFADFNNQA